MRVRRHARLLSVVAVLAELGAVLVAQQGPIFKGENRTVAVYTTVTNADGRLVPDLPREAFSILDERKLQPLTLFANDIQPITVVMLLDRSASMRSKFTLVEQAAEEFVNAMLPADKARIGSFSYRIQVDPRDFSSSQEELLAILRSELQEEGPTPLWNAVGVGITALLHQQGRRVILVFTDGKDAPGNSSSTNSSMKDIMKLAEEEDVMIYAIGLTGQNGASYGGRPGGGGGGRGGRGGFGRGGFGGGGFGGGGGRGGRGGYGGGYGGGGQAAADKPDEGLKKLAIATGGGYFELTSTNDLSSTFRRVADELHHQYALGFTPTALDGKMHALEVKLSSPEMVARARKRYLAERDR